MISKVVVLFIPHQECKRVSVDQSLRESLILSHFNFFPLQWVYLVLYLEVLISSQIEVECIFLKIPAESYHGLEKLDPTSPWQKTVGLLPHRENFELSQPFLLLPLRTLYFPRSPGREHNSFSLWLLRLPKLEYTVAVFLLLICCKHACSAEKIKARSCMVGNKVEWRSQKFTGGGAWMIDFL